MIWGLMEINLENCGSYNLEEVLNFRGRFENSLNSIKVREKYLIPLLGLEKVLEINSLVYATHFL